MPRCRARRSRCAVEVRDALRCIRHQPVPVDCRTRAPRRRGRTALDSVSADEFAHAHDAEQDREHDAADHHRERQDQHRLEHREEALDRRSAPRGRRRRRRARASPRAGRDSSPTRIICVASRGYRPVSASGRPNPLPSRSFAITPSSASREHDVADRLLDDRRAPASSVTPLPSSVASVRAKRAISTFATRSPSSGMRSERASPARRTRRHREPRRRNHAISSDAAEDQRPPPAAQERADGDHDLRRQRQRLAGLRERRLELRHDEDQQHHHRHHRDADQDRRVDQRRA